MTEEQLTPRWQKEPVATPQGSTVRPTRISIGQAAPLWWGAVGVLGVMLWLYLPTVRWLFQTWGRDEYYAHGPILPFISGYLIWQKRTQLREAWSARPPQGLAPSLLIWIALGMQVFGSLVEMNVMRALQAFSIPLLLLGIARYFGGKAFARELGFPLLFLWLAVPLSGPLIEVLTIPLQRYAASACAMMLGLLGMPITREGVNLYTPLYHFVVAVPCSGLKITITLFTMGVLIAHFMPKLPQFSRALLAGISIPVALLANTLRVMTIVTIGFYYGPKVAEGFLHKGSGLFMFSLSMLVLLGTGSILVRRQNTPIESPPAPQPQVGAA